MRMLFLLLVSFSAFAGVCDQYENDCEYYLCVSAEKQCDPSEYPVKFGHRFCMRYQERMATFSPAGKLWVEEVRKCLIREMNDFSDELSCSELKIKAFNSHGRCYVESGFCHLSARDKKTVVETIWPTIRNVYVLADGINILRKCH